MYQIAQQYLDDISFKINSMNRKIFDFKSAYDIECDALNKLIQSIFNNSHKILCVSAYLENKYQHSDIYKPIYVFIHDIKDESPCSPNTYASISSLEI